MLYFYSGTDREKARDTLNKALAKAAKKQPIVRISDANTLADLSEALRGSGMFGQTRAVVLDGVFGNEEMREIVLEALPHMGRSDELFYILEGKLDAETRKRIEKHAETSERFDAKKEKEGGRFFPFFFCLKAGEKKGAGGGTPGAFLARGAPGGFSGKRKEKISRR